ncbi:MAG: hypothetical protein HUU55_21865 [Myxococcales bacterium]|nr:hypothetical protein [Myxococcales bacterium]
MNHFGKRVVFLSIVLPCMWGYLSCSSESGGPSGTTLDINANNTDTRTDSISQDVSSPWSDLNLPKDQEVPEDQPPNPRDDIRQFTEDTGKPIYDTTDDEAHADADVTAEEDTEITDMVLTDGTVDIGVTSPDVLYDTNGTDTAQPPDIDEGIDIAVIGDTKTDTSQAIGDILPSTDTISTPDTVPVDDTDDTTSTPDTAIPVDVVAIVDTNEPDPPLLTITDVWPQMLPRGSLITLTLHGEAASQITGIDFLMDTQPDPEVFYIAGDATYLNELDQWSAPVFITPNAIPGPRTLVIQTDAGAINLLIEVDLAPGEMGAIAGSGDIGKTLGTVLASEMELFFPVALAWGEGILFFSDAGWNTLHAYNPQTVPKSLANGKFVIPPFHITRIAGTAIGGPSIDGDSLLIPLSEPKGLCYLPETDQGGPLLFFADTTHHQIRVLNLGDTPAVEMGMVVDPGFVVTLAGQPDFGYAGDGGPALQAKFFRPWRVRGCEGPLLLTGDVENYRIRAVNRSDSPVKVGNVTIAPGHVDTIAGTGVLGFSGDMGPANKAQVSIPKGFAFSKSGVIVFSDPENDRIRVINPNDQSVLFANKSIGPGNIDTVGTPGDLINFEIVVPGYNHPTGMRMDEYENLYVADTYSQTLKYHNFTSAPLYRANQWVWPSPTPVALAGIEHYKGDYTGFGPALSLVMADPFTVEYVRERGELYAADVENHVVLRLKLHTPYETWSGTEGSFPVLPPSSPAQPHMLDTDSGVLSLMNGKVYYLGGGSGVFNFTDMAIPAGVTLKLIGQRPGVLLSTGPMVIAGTILVESGSLKSGPGVGTGAGGGGHATAGSGVGAGLPYGDATLVPLVGGSAGGSGGAGGGGLLLASLEELTVSGTVSASGKSGGKPGAGSGGGIRLVSFGAMTITGTVSATGGIGQGAGAAGRIRIESAGAQKLSGNIKPVPSTATFSSQSPPMIPGI